MQISRGINGNWLIDKRAARMSIVACRLIGTIEPIRVGRGHSNVCPRLVSVVPVTLHQSNRATTNGRRKNTQSNRTETIYEVRTKVALRYICVKSVSFRLSFSPYLFCLFACLCVCVCVARDAEQWKQLERSALSVRSGCPMIICFVRPVT
ncbi:hypothetical protein GWI33_001187 [Rhynchophorus ferrugineus]|uniref:Uncharacterized protein n=1 Tax=Rhynchophorus ferrugineus TaxID=354439 RepID=A0A834HYK1_RHYFE|nr:hypothetical protein GWI33_001187 [Rhynchophorus ferrugineus]